MEEIMKKYLGYWLVINENNDPLYLEADRRIWLFFGREDAVNFIRTRDIDKKLGKVRKLIKVELVPEIANLEALEQIYYLEAENGD